MTKWMLAAGAAALAIVSPALAEKGGHGGGNQGNQGNKGGQQAKADRGGGGNQRAERGNRGGGGEMRAERGNRSGGQMRQQLAFQNDKHGHGQGNSRVREDHGNRGNQNIAKLERRNDDRRNNIAKMERHDRGNDRVRHDGDNRRERMVFRGNDNDRREVRIANFGRDRDDGVRFVPRWNDRGLVRGFDDGCPPGLAKKNNGCMPPGQSRKLVGTVLPAALTSQMLSGPYRDWYRDNDDYYYRWDNDYIYRVNRDNSLINAFFPYDNRDYYYYPVGMQYPGDYNYYNVPFQYQSYYPDNGDYWYRYGDGAIYQVNPSSGLISGIAALLTGNQFAVGQPLPSGYGVYNVPFGYRDQYYDTADNWYRYNDGYIYQVDPTTQLITAVINALV